MTNYGTITPRELYNMAKEQGVADIPIYICAICEAGYSGIASEIINVEKEDNRIVLKIDEDIDYKYKESIKKLNEIKEKYIIMEEEKEEILKKLMGKRKR